MSAYGICSILFVTLFCAEYFYIRIARNSGIVDTPNERSSHNYLPARGGGIIIPIAIIVWSIIEGTANNYFIAGLTLLSVVSFVDDMRPVYFLFRLIAQGSAVVLLLMQTSNEETSLFSNIFYFITILYFLNAYNFMDGINGITACYSLVAVASFLYLEFSTTTDPISNLLMYLAVTILVLLFFNFRKQALCFPGDVGSMGIAYVLAFLFLSIFTATQYLQYLVFFALYFVDSITTITQRLFNGENIFHAHRKHLYQLLSNEHKIDHRIVSSIYMLIQLVVNGIFILGGGGIQLMLIIYSILFVACITSKIMLGRKTVPSYK